MIIDCVSDLHGHYPELEGGDLLIVAGDLTATDSIEEHSEFTRWLRGQNYKRKIFIAGNHDNRLAGPWPGGTKGPFREDKAFYDFDYLCDSGTEFEGLKIWGSPWTKRFEGMNPHCTAFTLQTEEELAEKWAMIPNDVDILVTHGPPHGFLDLVDNPDNCGNHNVGSKTLSDKIRGSTKLKLHVFGHIHEYGGQTMQPGYLTEFVNSSHVNEHYEPVNKPIRIEL